MHSAALSDVLFLILRCNKVYVSNSDAGTCWSLRKPNSPLSACLSWKRCQSRGKWQHNPHMHIYNTRFLYVKFFAVVFLRDLGTLQYFRHQIPVIGIESNPQHRQFSRARGFSPSSSDTAGNHSCVLEAVGIKKEVHSAALPPTCLFSFHSQTPKDCLTWCILSPANTASEILSETSSLFHCAGGSHPCKGKVLAPRHQHLSLYLVNPLQQLFYPLHHH